MERAHDGDTGTNGGGARTKAKGARKGRLKQRPARSYRAAQCPRWNLEVE
jgi:hypothetical protein